MDLNSVASKWGMWLGIIGMLSTTLTVITSPFDKYNKYVHEQDSVHDAEDRVRIHEEVEVYIDNFETVVNMLDSMNHQLQGELDSIKAKSKSSKAVGLRQANGRFTFRDELGDVHQAFKETVQAPGGEMRIRFKYTHFKTGVNYYLFNRYYYD